MYVHCAICVTSEAYQINYAPGARTEGESNQKVVKYAINWF